MTQSFVRLAITLVASVIINAILIWRFALTNPIKEVVKYKILSTFFH